MSLFASSDIHCAIWINEKVMTVIPETCICPAYLPNLMTSANRKQFLAAVFICAAVC